MNLVRTQIVRQEVLAIGRKFYAMQVWLVLAIFYFAFAREGNRLHVFSQTS